MQSYKKVIVGVDFNERTQQLPAPTVKAIKRGIWLAQMNQVNLTLLCVLPETYKNSEAQLEQSGGHPEATVRELLANLLQSDAESPNASTVVKFAYGKGWYELLQEVLLTDSDLIIIGTRERNVAQRMLYGSTAMKLIRNCPCPVLVTRPENETDDVPVIVAADDLSPVGEKVLHASVSAAQMLEARLLVVNAVDYPLEGAMMRTEAPQEDLDSYRENCRRNAEAEVFERLSMTDYRTIQQGTQIVIQGGPADTVVEQVVKDNNAQLLVMGTIARGGIPGFLIGNTAERILPELDCSVLAIKPDDFVSPVKPRSA